MSNSTLSTNGTDCVVDGNSDIYGLGIRIGFYLQWYGSVIASMPRRRHGQLAGDEVQGLIYANIIFSVATFIALASQTSNLQLSEIYIVLLLIFGYQYFAIPVIVFDLVETVMQIFRGGNGASAAGRGWVYNLLFSILLFAISCFQLWFWASHFQSGGQKPSCPDFGFALNRVELDNKGFRAFNLTWFSLLLIASLLFTYQSWQMFSTRRKATGSVRDTLSTKPSRSSLDNSRSNSLLQYIRSAALILFVTIVVIAVEASITWNHISGVGSLDSAGQLIPFFVGLGAILRVFYVGFRDWHFTHDMGYE
ncbi:Beta-ketoacyl synthase protein [Rutstroemia sp. NJR-2017a BBW]|nr:Beta-ketoacyl synthase protein [Rutstroemia sp. NJR-2017a BBW]